jgi:hypothetical protein
MSGMPGLNQPVVKLPHLPSPRTDPARRCGGAGRHELAGVVDPVRRRHVLHPPVVLADVGQHHVLDQADAVLARFLRQAHVVLVAAVARVDLVMVGGGVAVVGRGRHVVLHQRRRPQLGKAHAGDVVEVVDHALDVAAVAAVAQLAVQFIGHAGDAVVFRIAVGEAVRHDLVDRVLGIEAMALARSRLARQQAVGIADGLALAAEIDAHVARRRLAVDDQVDEQVVAVGDPRDLGDAHAGIVQRRFALGDGGAVHHQLHALLVHAGPPERRLDVVDGGRLGAGREGCCGGGHEGGADEDAGEGVADRGMAGMDLLRVSIK